MKREAVPVFVLALVCSFLRVRCAGLGSLTPQRALPTGAMTALTANLSCLDPSLRLPSTFVGAGTSTPLAAEDPPLLKPASEFVDPVALPVSSRTACGERASR